MAVSTPLEKIQAGYESGNLARLTAVADHLLTATGIAVPDFDALAREAAVQTACEAAAGTCGDSRENSGGNSGEAPVTLKGIPGLNPYATADPLAESRVSFVKSVLESPKPAGTWSELCRRFDMTEPQVRRFARKALKARFLLPRLYAKVLRAGSGFDRLDYAAGRAFDIDPSMYDFFDRCLATIEERAGIISFKSTVDTAIALLKTPTHESERAHQDRCVRSYSLGDGRSVVEMTGPTLEVEAFMKRLEAFARNIRISLSGLLDTAETPDGKTLADAGIDPATVTRADERTMAQLMFDMLTAYAPTLGIRITHSTDNLDSCAADTDTSVPDEPHGTTVRESTDSIVLHMPTRESWLASQAKVSILVPVTTALGLGSLPGSLAGVEPIPADVARRLTANQPALYRLLCDPATGQILPEQAKSYQVSPSLRRTLESEWTWCAMPGCTRPAVRCETEHVDPFNHHYPAEGGTSELANLQIMCRAHHQAKTAGQIKVSKNPDGSLTYAWTSPTAPTGFSTQVAGHRHLTGAIAARELTDELTRLLTEAAAARTPRSNTDDQSTPATEHDGTAVPSTRNTADCSQFPLQENWDSLCRDEKNLPAVRGLRDMLAASGLLPPVPPLKLSKPLELEVLYRIIRAAHHCRIGPDGTCVDAGTTEVNENPNPGTTSPVEGADGVPPDAQAIAWPGRFKNPARCPYVTPYAPLDWTPADWIPWARHRTLDEILADPWRRNDPVETCTDSAHTGCNHEQAQAEDEADRPPF